MLFRSDPKDNILLEVAAASHAHYLVTGDKDLLEDAKLVDTMFQEYHVQIIATGALLMLLAEQTD